MTSSEKACRDCIDSRFRLNNYVWNEEEVPGEHFCKWCGRMQPSVYVFDFENRILADQRKKAAQERERYAAPQRDTRAHYRPPWRESE